MLFIEIVFPCLHIPVCSDQRRQALISLNTSGHCAKARGSSSFRFHRESFDSADNASRKGSGHLIELEVAFGAVMSGRRR